MLKNFWAKKSLQEAKIRIFKFPRITKSYPGGARENGSNDFPNSLHEVRGPYGLKTCKNRFFEKSLIFRKNGLKGPKNGPPDPKMSKMFLFFFTRNHSIRKKKQ